MVSERELCLPMVTLPKSRLVGFALNAPGVTPVPETPIVNPGLTASDVIVTVPLTFPLDVGVNLTVNVVLCEAPRLSGVVIPLIANAALSTET